MEKKGQIYSLKDSAFVKGLQNGTINPDAVIAMPVCPNAETYANMSDQLMGYKKDVENYCDVDINTAIGYSSGGRDLGEIVRKYPEEFDSVASVSGKARNTGNKEQDKAIAETGVSYFAYGSVNDGTSIYSKEYVSSINSKGGNAKYVETKSTHGNAAVDFFKSGGFERLIDTEE